MNIFYPLKINCSQAGSFIGASGPGAAVETLTGNSGGPVSPTLNNINLLGGNNITTVGTPGTSTITFNVTGTTNHAIQIGNASGSLTSLPVASNGQIPIGSTGADPVIANLTAGSNISITNGAGSITIAANANAQVVHYVAITHGDSPYAALATDYYIGADVTGGSITVQLPNAPTVGRVFIVKDKAGLSATSNITVTTVGGAVNIDGATTFVMNTNYESANFLFNGTFYEVW